MRDTWEDTTPHYFNSNPNYTAWNAYPKIELDKPEVDYKRSFEDVQTGYVYVHGWFWAQNVKLISDRIEVKGWFGAYHGYGASRANFRIVIGVPEVFDQRRRPDAPWLWCEWTMSSLGAPNGSVGNYIEGYIILKDPPEYSFTPSNPKVNYNRITELVGKTVNILFGYNDSWSADWNQWAAVHKDSVITVVLPIKYTIELLDSFKVGDQLTTRIPPRIELKEILGITEPKVTSEVKSVKYLRYVTDHVDTFEDFDHNDHVNNWYVQLIINDLKAEEKRVELPENDDLASIVYKMKYVHYKEKYYSEHHNLFVDAWKLQLVIDKKLWGDVPDARTILSELEKVVLEMEYIYSGEYYHDILHNLFKEAWDLQKELNKIPVLPPTVAWPTYHYNNKRTGVSEGETLLILGGTDGKIRSFLTSGELYWEYQTGDRVYANPIIDSEGIIYVGSWDYNFYAIRKNGELLWKFETGDRIACPAALTEDEEYIYFYSSDGYLYKLDREGNVIWKYYFGDWFEWSGPGPLIADKLYFGAIADYFWAFDFEGNLIWKVYIEYSSLAPPSLHDSGDIIVSEYSTHRITPDGVKLWSVELSYYATNNKDSSPIPFKNWIFQLGGDACLYIISDDATIKIYHGIDHKGASTPVAMLINEQYVYLWYSSYYYRFRFGVFDMVNITFADIHFYDFEELIGDDTAPCMDAKGRIYVPTKTHVNALSWNYETGFSIIWRYQDPAGAEFSSTRPSVV